MSDIKIVTDSTIVLDENQREELDISIVPLTISLDEVSYRDGIDISPKQFIEKMAKASELPRTSQPAVGHFLEVFNEKLKVAKEVLSINLSDKLSGTINAARQAAKMADGKVTVFHSQQIADSLGFQVCEAAKMAKKGFTMDAIVERLEVICKNTKLYIVVDTFENLVKGGRIGRAKAALGSILKIKPVLEFTETGLIQKAKPRSSGQVINFLVKQFLEDIKDKTVKGIGITHADGYPLAEKLKHALMEVSDLKNIPINFAPPVISTHTGAGAIALIYYAE